MSNHELDPSTISNLDQQETEFNNRRDEFVEQFGFTHECRCGQDYTDGNTTEVTACFIQLTYDALEACARMKETIEDLEEELNGADDDTGA